MKLTFKNIDKSYIKMNQEPLGDIQPKFWFRDAKTGEKMLVKRQQSLKVQGTPKKSRCFNHVGEYFGYLLAKKTGIDACPVELITLHDTKNKYSKIKNLYTACGSKKVSKVGQTLMMGEVIVNRFKFQDYQTAKEISNLKEDNLQKGNIYVNDENDNVDFAINSVISETIRYENAIGKQSKKSIVDDVQANVKKNDRNGCI